jgi:hypothetical protein
MKTLYPVIISFGLMIPFSPVGKLLWHTGQETSVQWISDSQALKQQWSGKAQDEKHLFSDWLAASRSNLQQGLADKEQRFAQQTADTGHALRQVIEQTGLGALQTLQQQSQTLGLQVSGLWDWTIMEATELGQTAISLPQKLWPQDEPQTPA